MANIDMAAYFTARREYDKEALVLQIRINRALTQEERDALGAQLETHLMTPPDPAEFVQTEAE